MSDPGKIIALLKRDAGATEPRVIPSDREKAIEKMNASWFAEMRRIVEWGYREGLLKRGRPELDSLTGKPPNA